VVGDPSTGCDPDPAPKNSNVCSFHAGSCCVRATTRRMPGWSRLRRRTGRRGLGTVRVHRRAHRAPHLLVPALRPGVGGPAVRAGRGRHLAGAGSSPAELAVPTRGAVSDRAGRWCRVAPSASFAAGVSPLLGGCWARTAVCDRPIANPGIGGSAHRNGSPVPSPEQSALRDETEDVTIPAALVTVAPTPTTPRFDRAPATSGEPVDPSRERGEVRTGMDRGGSRRPARRSGVDPRPGTAQIHLEIQHCERGTPTLAPIT